MKRALVRMRGRMIGDRHPGGRQCADLGPVHHALEAAVDRIGRDEQCKGKARLAQARPCLFVYGKIGIVDGDGDGIFRQGSVVAQGLDRLGQRDDLVTAVFQLRQMGFELVQPHTGRGIFAFSEAVIHENADMRYMLTAGLILGGGRGRGKEDGGKEDGGKGRSPVHGRGA